MKIQSGHIKLEATIGDLTYYRKNGKYLVKRKSCVSRTRLKYSPQYAAFRQHQKDFGQASSGSKLIRSAVAPVMEGLADSYCASRLTARLLTVIKSDQGNSSGQRIIQDRNLAMLKGFEFNKKCALSRLLKAPIRLTGDSGSRSVSLQISEFIPSRLIQFPKSASHCQLVMGIVSVDFETGMYQSAFKESEWIPVDRRNGDMLTLTGGFQDTIAHPVIVVAGLRFSQFVSGEYEVL